MSGGRGPFVGRCHICGVQCGRTYCNEHRDLAQHLALPDRRDTVPAPTREDVKMLMALLDEQERKLQGWRRVAENGKVRTC